MRIRVLIMPTQRMVEQLAALAGNRLGGNLRLLGIYGSGSTRPEAAPDLDFLLVVDYVENCVTYASRDCRDLYPNVQFFVLSAAEYACLPRFFRFQFAFAHKLLGDLELPEPSREDAVESIQHGFTDTLRTLRQQFKRREWAIADDWARQTWWNLKSFKYALHDTCWLLRQQRPPDAETASLILLSEGMNASAEALTDWPASVEIAAQQLLRNPLPWIVRWERRVSAAYGEVRPYLHLK